jgi:hypothetical protein
VTRRSGIKQTYSLGYSKKGYIDGELGQAWIAEFDKATRAKAGGHRRLLLVDGHVSHCTRGFLEYARAHRIEVVSYPSHSTHIYQGLDVVIFATMKRNWSDARDSWERKGGTVDKTNFLEVYAEAHFKTLTVENIRSAFRKTGVVPLNPDAITEQMMAPSLETSTRSTLPIVQPTPVRVMSAMVRDYYDYQTLQDVDTPGASGSAVATGISPRRTTAPLFIQTAMGELATTSASFLASSSPLKSSSAPPTFKTSMISPFHLMRYHDLLESAPRTTREQELQEALRESEARNIVRKERLIGMQAGVVLAQMYVDRAQGQLQALEGRKEKQGKKRLLGDGSAKWFSGDAFYDQCVADEQAREGDAEAKEKRRVEREDHATQLAAWKKENMAIRERNDTKKVIFGDAVKAWLTERAISKQEKRRPGWAKPKWKDYDPERLLPRPKRLVVEEDEEGEDDDEEDEGDDAIDCD